MPKVLFTQNLQRHIEVPPCTVPGATVREVLDSVFSQHPRARDYVLDEQGAVRRHMVVFVDGSQIEDRTGLSDSVPEHAEVCVMQALSGG